MPRLLIVANVAEMFRDFLLPYGKHFRSNGWQVDAMASGILQSAECRSAFDHTLDIDWARGPLNSSNFLRAPNTVRQEVAKGNYDLVHVHTPTAAFVTRFALRERNTTREPKIIYTAHGFHFHPEGSAIKNCIFRHLEKIAGNWTDYLVVINRTDEAAAKAHGLMPANKIVYMPGIGVDLHYYNPKNVQSADVQAFRSEIGVSPATPILLMLAEFVSNKRHVDAVRAFSLISNQSVHLVLGGEGPLMSEIKRLANELGIAERVHFLGYRRDVPIMIRASAATILPSAREGLPRCVLESLCMGTPVISCDIRGSRDLLTSGVGILVPVGDLNQLSKAMSWILENPRAATEMGGSGPQLVAAYDLSHILRLHELLYERALACN